ncbi:MAG: type I-G CRISPR-associated protein Csb2 [Stellaceae bacterium]
MTLVLEIEHLLGVAFAARTPASDRPDWPPQPDRTFSALTAAWAVRGARAEERGALEWLEGLAVPEIAASQGWPRTAPTVFVPPNDPETGRVGNPAVLPALRRRQARRFPAYRPEDAIVRFIWRDAVADAATLAALNALAADTSYLGHSASLVRLRFASEGGKCAGAQAKRRVYPGRLAELERAYQAGKRPTPGDAVPPAPASTTPAAESLFSDRWLVLEPVGGEAPMPDLRAAAPVARLLHKTLMCGYQRIGLGEAIPPVVSGHRPDGAPLDGPHLAIVPLAFIGMPYADGAVYGFALIPPRQGDLFADPTFQQALRKIMPWNDGASRRELTLCGEGVDLVLALAGDGARRSLDPAPYVAEARVWATSTPIVLDRHLKESGNEARQTEIENLVRRACPNIDLPQPERVMADKHSALAGAPSAYPSGRAPSWTGWRLPPSLANRQLTHAMIAFEKPVKGPVILGAGRFAGLGLCRALDRPERRE